METFSSVQRRVTSANIARRIIRKKLSSQINDEGVDRCEVDGTNVAYRNCDGISYVDCAFLDEYDTILAVNERGHIDIIRLPQYDGRTTEPTRPLGHALHTDISLHIDRNSSTSIRPRCRKIYSYQNGQAFVVGMDFGEFRIFSTERIEDAPTGNTNYNPTATSTTTTTTNISNQLGIRTLSSIATNSSTIYSYEVPALTRKYHRSHEFSLAEQLQDPNTGLSELRRIQEMTNTSYIYPFTHWDFREGSSGSIQALYIGDDKDCFGFRLLDSRTPKSVYDICIDLDMSDHSFTTSVRFLNNDNYVASSWYTDNDRGIKIWDIRMLKKKDAFHSSIFLPSFPHDHIHGLRAITNITPSRVGPGRNNRTMSSNVPVLQQTTDLFPLSNGNILVLDSNRPSYYVIDPIQRTTKSSFVNFGSPSFKPVAIDQQNGYIISYEHRRMDDSNYEIDRVNFHAVDDCCCSYLSLQCNNNHNKRNKRTYDTLQQDGCNKGDTTTPNNNNNNNSNRDENKGDFVIPTKIQDRNGLSTELSCLSCNNSGSSVLGASYDGDIFVWRAS